MELTIAVERLAALTLGVVSLSHVAAPRAWVHYFVTMREHGAAAGLRNGLLHLPLGAAVLTFHPIWSGPGLVTTLVGAGLTAKATAHLLYPPLSQWTLAPVDEERAWGFRLAGVFGLALAAAIAWLSLRLQP